MSPAANDDYQELSALLFGVSERYRSARATVRHRRRGGLTTEAIYRYVEYGFRNNILSNFDPPYHEPRYREYGDLDEGFAEDTFCLELPGVEFERVEP
jgi:hypothetical protein